MTNEVAELLDALHDGTMTLDEVAERFRARRWPRRSAQMPTSYYEMAAAELVDPEPYVPGSTDDLMLAYDLGKVTDAQYAVLIEAIVASERAEDAASE